MLANLPDEVCDRLHSELEWVRMKLGQVLNEPGSPSQYVYFPTEALVSLLHVLKDGSAAAFALVGNEGMVGLSHVTDCGLDTSQAVVQSAGYAFRINGKAIKQEFDRAGPLQHIMLRYLQALIVQMSQTAVCNRHHSVEQQFCRSLLLSIDRLPEDKLTMTQELIANMLGVRREGVTAAAGKLRTSGVIRYGRGKITVLDRMQLERESCECYAVVKRETDRLLPNRKAV